jgi:hypothetical protein
MVFTRAIAGVAIMGAFGIALWGGDTPVATAPGDQGLELDIASDGAGGAFVVWQDRRYSRVRLQRIDAAGEKAWGAAKDVAISEWEKFEPAIVEDGSGGAIVAWAEGRSGVCTRGFKADCDIYAQRFSPEGARLWGDAGVPVTLAPANQGASGFSMTTDENGGAFLAWEDARPDCCKVYAQHLLADGTVLWAPDGIRLSPEPTISFGPMSGLPQAVSDGAGGVIVVWLENQVDPEVEPPPVTVQRVDASGEILWPENGVRVGVPQFVTFSVVGDGAGGAFVAFIADTEADFGEMSVQRVGPNGTPLWGANGSLLGEADYYAETPDVIADGNGGAIVTWVNHAFDEIHVEESIDVYAQRLDAAGTPVWEAGGKPLCTFPGEQDDPRILGDGEGGAIVVWRDCRDYPERIACFFGSDIYAQHVRPDGTELWPTGGTPVSAAPGPQSVGQGTPPRHFIHMTTDTAGGAVVVWPDGRRGGCENAIYITECDVFAQRINSTPPVPSCGDPTGDGEVTATDALFTLNAAVGLVSCDLAYCDVNDSGAVSAPDALAILNFAIGLAVELACPDP